MLTTKQAEKLTELEAIIQDNRTAIFECQLAMGKALRTIRDKNLHRAKYRTMEGYARFVWELRRRELYRLINAANVADNIGNLPLPHNLAQTEQLAKVEPDQQKEIWRETLKGGKVTAAQIKSRVKITHPPAKPLRKGSIRLFNCDFQDLPVKKNSVNLILTDFPYAVSFTEEIPRFSEFASRVLRPDGLLVVYIGKTDIPGVTAALSSQLKYVWTLAASWNHGKRILGCWFPRWQPILIYAKNKKLIEEKQRKKKVNIPDHFNVTAAQEKEFHPWQKNIADIEKLVEWFSVPGDLVVDPMAGSFTTAMACRNLGRKCIAGDIDTEAYQVGLRRMGEA